MVDYVTEFGSIHSYRKGGVQPIQDDPRNYVFSNIFEVAARSAPWERVVVGKNFEYVIEVARAEGDSPWYTACLLYTSTRDLLEAMAADMGAADTVIRVDGGMSASDWTMQFLADILGAPVDRPAWLETTAMGAACLAGMQAGLYPDLDSFAAGWRGGRSPYAAAGCVASPMLLSFAGFMKSRASPA